MNLAVLALLFADVTSARISAYDWQIQDAQGNRISDHQRSDTAIIACLNNPACVFVQGGRYRIGSTSAPPPPATGTAALSWSAPTKNTDGSNLTDLAGYKVYHGTSASALTDTVQITGLTYTYGNLPRGTHYFAVAAYNSAGVESALSGVGSKVIP